MADYERYGEYNSYEGEEDEGPAPSRGWVIFSHVIRWVCICLLVFVCGMLAFRIILSKYYPDAMEELYYTDALTAYAENNEVKAETQKILVNFEREIIEKTDGEELEQGVSYNGYYYADNLIVVRDAGVLQCSLRLNKHAIEEIAAAYEIPGFAFSYSAFDLKLVYKNPETGATLSYEPTVIATDSAMLYYYMKICFDNVDFDADGGVGWFRLEITPRGADTTAADYLQQAILVYENNDHYATFEPYDD